MTLKQLKEAIKDFPDDCKVKVYDADYDIDFNTITVEINEEEDQVSIVFDHDF